MSNGTAIVLVLLVRVKKMEEPTLSLIGLKLHQLWGSNCYGFLVAVSLCVYRIARPAC